MFPTLTPDQLADARSRFDDRFIDHRNDDIILSAHTYVVRTAHHVIVIDTCNGNHKSRQFMPELNNLDTPYVARLLQAGVRPEDVDFVLCTHLHPDHIGWNTREENGRWVPTFPSAKYLMSRLDYEHFSLLGQTQPEGPERDLAEAFNDSVLPVVEHEQAVLLAGDEHIEHEIDSQIRIESAPGHTSGHVIAHLESRGRRAVATGDVIHHLLQLNNLDLFALGDSDPAQAAATRRLIIEAVADTDTVLLPGHFPSPTAGHVVSDGDELRYVFAQP